LIGNANRFVVTKGMLVKHVETSIGEINPDEDKEPKKDN
jgi:hypothetical protein